MSPGCSNECFATQGRTNDVPLPADLCRASLLDFVGGPSSNRFIAEFALAILCILFLSFG
jgi:hypothetical protein